MIHTGLVSVTFRSLTPRAIVDLTARAELDAIEWGGDLHVPPGDLARAKDVRTMTSDAGIDVCSYGSYYHAGHDEQEFEAVLATAKTLHAPLIRVWAGRKGSAEADAAYRSAVVHDSRRIADLAARAGITVAYEFHGNTLTDTRESALQMLREVGHDHLTTYWQPPVNLSPDERLAGLNDLLPWLTNVHVFHWQGDPPARRPLVDGTVEWQKYLDAVGSAGGDHYALLEFVRDDSPETFLDDAATLRRWVGLLRPQERV